MAVLVKEGSPPIDVTDPVKYKEALEAGYTPRGTITLVDERGHEGEYTPEQAELMFQQRAQLSSGESAQQERRQQNLENEYGDTSEKIRAFGEGALSAATLGGYDVAQAALGNEDGIRARAEMHPGTRTAGEVVGAVGSALVGGGAGVVSKVASYSPASLAFRGATKLGAKAGGGAKSALAVGAIEGAAQGAGAAVSNLAISDVPLTVESVVSEVGLNVLLGGGFGAAGGLAGYGLIKGGEKLLNKATDAQSALTSNNLGIARETLGSVSSTTKEAFKEIDSVAPRLLSLADDVDAGFGSNLDSVALQNSQNTLTQAAASLRSKAHLGGKGQRLVTQMDDAQKKFLSAVKSGDDDLIRESLENFHTRVNKLNRIVGTSDTAVPDVVTRVSQKVEYARPEGFDDVYKASKAAYAEAAELGLTKDPMKQLMRSGSAEELFEKASKLDKLTKSLQELDALVGEGKFASKLIEPLERASAKATETLGEGAQEMTLVGLAAVLGIEEALVPDMPGPLDEIVKVALAATLAKKAGATAGRGGKWLKGVASAAASRAGRNAGWRAGKGGVQSAVAATIGESVAGKAVQSALGSSKALQSSTTNMSIRLSKAFSKIMNSGGKVSRGAPIITGTLLRQTSFSTEPPPKKETENQAFHRIADEVATLSMQPAQRLHENLGPIRIGSIPVGDAMYGHLVNTVEFLNQRMPRDHGRLQNFGRSKWRPTEADKARLAKLIAATDAGAAVERLAEGRMTREDAEALRVLNPATFKQVQNFLIDNLDDLQSLSYEHRIQISTLMGVEADPVVSRTKVWQQTFLQAAEDQAKPQMGGTASKPTPGTTAQKLSGD